MGGCYTWSFALLPSAQRLANTLQECLTKRFGGVVAIGPLGEGKSLAIRQVALQIAIQQPEWNVFWREPGAPSITEEWLVEMRSSYDRLLICADEADLISHELALTKEIWTAPGSEVCWLLASQDRLWWRSGQSMRDEIGDVLFHGITEADSIQITNLVEIRLDIRGR